MLCRRNLNGICETAKITRQIGREDGRGTINYFGKSRAEFGESIGAGQTAGRRSRNGPEDYCRQTLSFRRRPGTRWGFGQHDIEDPAACGGQFAVNGSFDAHWQCTAAIEKPQALGTSKKEPSKWPVSTSGSWPAQLVR